MNSFKAFFVPNSLDFKIRKIKAGIKHIISEYSTENFWLIQYGEYNISPKYLVIVICVKSDNEKKALSQNTKLGQKIRELFLTICYPVEFNDKFAHFESQETVNRVANGNWYEYLK
jgi:hypothetical protein